MDELWQIILQNVSASPGGGINLGGAVPAILQHIKANPKSLSNLPLDDDMLATLEGALPALGGDLSMASLGALLPKLAPAFIKYKRKKNASAGAPAQYTPLPHGEGIARIAMGMPDPITEEHLLAGLRQMLSEGPPPEELEAQPAGQPPKLTARAEHEARAYLARRQLVMNFADLLAHEALEVKAKAQKTEAAALVPGQGLSKVSRMLVQDKHDVEQALLHLIYGEQIVPLQPQEQQTVLSAMDVLFFGWLRPDLLQPPKIPAKAA